MIFILITVSIKSIFFQEHLNCIKDTRKFTLKQNLKYQYCTYLIKTRLVRYEVNIVARNTKYNY